MDENSMVYEKQLLENSIVRKLNDFIFKLPSFSDEDLKTISINLETLLNLPSDDENMEEYDRPLILRKNLWVDDETMKTLFLGYTVKTLFKEKEFLQKEKEEY